MLKSNSDSIATPHTIRRDRDGEFPSTRALSGAFSADCACMLSCLLPPTGAVSPYILRRDRHADFATSECQNTHSNGTATFLHSKVSRNAKYAPLVSRASLVCRREPRRLQAARRCSIRPRSRSHTHTELSGDAGTRSSVTRSIGGDDRSSTTRSVLWLLCAVIDVLLYPRMRAVALMYTTADARAVSSGATADRGELSVQRVGEELITKVRTLSRSHVAAI